MTLVRWFKRAGASKRAALLTATVSGAVFLSACTAELVRPDDGPSATGSGGHSSSTGGQTGVVASGEFPCDVQAFLTTNCQSCHSAASPVPMMTHADLVQASGDDPTLTLAEASLVRLAAGDGSRMPPSPSPTPPAADIEAFAAWVNAGAPQGSCSGDLPPPPPDPYDTPVVCTSGSHWTGGNEESPNMNPGEACISCHTKEREGPHLTIAGTLYPTAHEPGDCNGVPGSSAIYVEITDAAGRVFELSPRSSGNFMLEDPDSFTMPYTAKVVAPDGERVMVGEQDDGDCNSCHTEAGTDGAPGRIMLP